MAGIEIDSQTLWPAQGPPQTGTNGPSPGATQGWRLNHTMYRISNPEKSLPFYRDVLGLRRVMTLNNGPCTVYYLGYYQGEETSGKDMFAHQQERDGLLELVFLNGTLNDPIQSQFGHIGITVPDIKAAEARLCAHGVEIYKPLGEADKKGMCIDEADWSKGPDLTEGFKKVFSNMMMIRDPDGYFIEIVPYKAG